MLSSSYERRFRMENEKDYERLIAAQNESARRLKIKKINTFLNK